MSWFRLGLLISFSLFLSPVHLSAEQQQSQSGFRRLFVLQSGSVGSDGGVRVSSISTHRGEAGKHMYKVDLNANFGGQVRSRRMGNQAASVPQLSQPQPVFRLSEHEQRQPKQPMKLSGVNVCGGQCCHGWSKVQGSQRCTKPNCIPQCQNGGMCLRPQLCVCKSGSNGKSCEQKTHPFPALPGNGPINGHTSGHTNGHQWPIPQQAPPNGYASVPSPSNNMAQMKLSVKSAPQLLQPHYIQQHIQQHIQSMPVQPVQSQQYVIKPKYYHTQTTYTQTSVQPQRERPIPLAVGHNPIHADSNTGRIKVIFTPTICKLTCIGSRCHNSCKEGNTTTIISENGHATDTLTAPNFRVVVCHLPCMNGGKCSARDRCQCPPNFTGKFCQIPVDNGHQQTPDDYSQTQVHATHTLPLSYSIGQSTVFSPSIVNIHIKHPPEASVKVHQVSQLDNYHNGHPLQGSQSGSSSPTSYSYHQTESSQKIQHHSYNVVYPRQHGYQVSQYQPVTSKNMLGRCFQETTGNQCGKALPGLTKQEQCCATIGTSWGFHKCQQCPKKLSIPLIGCPQGYKRINSSLCQDLDECQLHGMCLNGNCMNTIGSYRCMCKPGYVPDSTFTTCISNTPAIQEKKGACFRLVSSERQCLHPLSTQLSKQLCCCSVGKAWGPRCDKCPLLGTAEFKEICPGGMGYTVLPNPPVKPVTIYQESTVLLPSQPLPTSATPMEAFGKSEEMIPEVVERNSPPAPVEILPSNEGQDIAPTQSVELDECQISPYICGQGICYNTAQGYTCHCHEGYHLDDTQTTCADIDECGLNETLCSPHGFCENSLGSFRCLCDQGYQESQDGQYCVDVNECMLLSSVCGEAQCVNVNGSFLCVCPSGQDYNIMIAKCEPIPTAPSVERKDCYYRLNNENLCESVLTSHVTLQECCCTLGAGWGDNCEVHPCPVNGTDQFNQMCPFGKGFILSGEQLYGVPTDDSYKDADECTLFGEEVCKGGFCLDTVGSYECYCKTGQDYDSTELECKDINECLDETVCVGGECLNTDGSFMCFCTHPMKLDPNSNHCVFNPEEAEQHEVEHIDYLGICWQTVTETMTCTLPLAAERKTTYTECCCLYGEGWGMDCALCPAKNTEDYASMCNLHLGGMQQPYTHDSLATGPDHEYAVSQDFLPSPEQQAILPFFENEEYLSQAFEGLQAEECGILNGCENGRCVRVQEGFTCDCFDGYSLDLSRMACIDVNECSELNNRMSLCKNAKCINTAGSFQCVCLPGFIASDKPNYCVEATTHQTSIHTQ
uniref:latent-transforming growth factor beta-binding protein 1 isoform X2 n=1 Tax=Scatophagus argus TaxID=75038 RepID=UPI001ED7F9E3|nr:latent-transforming growth factor beta-binding protein 1 isoform X2 [Scatophagus argus]